VISVVIPAHNEAKGIANALQVIAGQLYKTGFAFELVVVDDGSGDETWDIVKAAKIKHGRLKAVRLSRCFGKESAISAGLANADGDAVILMDSDLQHPPELIPEMVRLWQEEGFEVVDGVKSNRGNERRIDRFLANLFYRVMQKMSGYRLKDASDFKLMDRKVIDAWKQLGERNLFFRGMSAWTGFKRTELAFDVADRQEGESKWSKLRLLGLAVTAIVSFSSVPLRLITILGGIFFIIAAVLGVQTLFVKMSGDAVDGFTTVILLLLTTGSLLMICLGIIGEYIARIYDEVKQRPRYIIRDRIAPEE